MAGERKPLMVTEEEARRLRDKLIEQHVGSGGVVVTKSGRIISYALLNQGGGDAAGVRSPFRLMKIGGVADGGMAFVGKPTDSAGEVLKKGDGTPVDDEPIHVQMLDPTTVDKILSDVEPGDVVHTYKMTEYNGTEDEIRNYILRPFDQDCTE